MSPFLFLSIGAILLLGFAIKQFCGAVKTPVILLATVCCIIIFLVITGGFRILWLGTILLYLVSAASLGHIVIMLVRKQTRPVIEYFSSVPVIAFVVACVYLYIFYAHIYDAYYYAWDEFAFWGPFYKGIKLNHQFLVLSPNNTYCVHGSYPQGVSAFYYFTSFFLPQFSEFATQFAKSVLYAACGATFLGAVSWKRPVSAVLSILLLPVLFCFYVIAGTYSNVMLDTLLGVFFGAGLAVVLSQKTYSWPNTIILALVLGTITQIKESGFILAIFCALFYFIFMVFHPAQTGFWATIKANIHRALWAHTGVLVGATVVSLAFWKIILKTANYTEPGFTEINLSLFFGQILSSIRGEDPFASNVFMNLWQAFLQQDMYSFEGFKTVHLFLLYLVICLGLGIAWYRKTQSYTLLVAPLAMPAFFVLYHLALFYTYTCTMQSYADKVLAYARYMSSFFIGWGMLAFTMCMYYGNLLLKNKKAEIIPVAALTFLLSINIHSVVAKDTYSLSYPKFTYYRGWQEYYSEQFTPYFETDDWVWLVDQSENSLYNTMMYRYFINPSIAPYGYYSVLGSNSEYTYTPYTKFEGAMDIDHFVDTLKAENFTYVLILESDAILHDEFGSIFSDKLESIEKGPEPVLYQVQQDDNDRIILELVKQAAPLPSDMIPESIEP